MAMAGEMKRVTALAADAGAVNVSITSLIGSARSTRPSLIGEGAGSSLYALDKAALIAALDALRITARQQRLDALAIVQRAHGEAEAKAESVADDVIRAEMAHVVDQQKLGDENLEIERARLEKVHDDAITTLLSSEDSREYKQEIERIRRDEAKRADDAARDMEVTQNQMTLEFSEEKKRSEAAHNQVLLDLIREQDHLDARLGTSRVAGEIEALALDVTHVIDLRPTRGTAFTNAHEIHFRLAESQFLRIMKPYECHVYAVDYIVNPTLVKRFEAKQNLYKASGRESQARLCFFQTPAQFDHSALENIIHHGVQIANPLHRSGTRGSTKASHPSGMYFSEYTTNHFGSFEAKRMTPAAKKIGAVQSMQLLPLLVCRVLPGNSFHCGQQPGQRTWRGCQAGYDSHTTVQQNGDSSVVVWDNDVVLPCYLVYYGFGSSVVHNTDTLRLRPFGAEGSLLSRARRFW